MPHMWALRGAWWSPSSWCIPESFLSVWLDSSGTTNIFSLFDLKQTYKGNKQETDAVSMFAMPRNRAFSEPEYSAEYSADCSVTLPSDPGQAVGRTHEVTVRSSGCCLCLPRFMRLTFTPESLENLYQTYFRRQRHETLLVLVVFAALFDSYIIVMCAVVYTTDKLASVLVASVGLAADIILYLLCRFSLLPDRISRRVVPYALWVLIAAQIFCYLGLNYARFHQASDTVGWQAFFSFSFFLTLPLRLTPIVLITSVSCGVHTLVLGVTIAQQQQEDIQAAALGRQVRVRRMEERWGEGTWCNLV